MDKNGSTLSSMNTRLATFFVLFLCVMGQIPIDVYVPSLPAMVSSLNAPTTSVQLTITVYLFSFALSQLFYGPLSDRFGRRPILLVGLGLYVLSSILCVSAATISILLIGRFFQGVAIGCASVLSRAIMRDVFTGTQLAKVSAYLAMAWSSIPILAPIAGGYIQEHLGWRSNFGLMLIMAITGFCIIAFFFKETKQSGFLDNLHIKSISRDYMLLVKQRSFVGYVLCVLCLYGVFIVFSVAVPFLIQVQLGYSAVAYAWFSVLAASGYFLGSYACARLVSLWASRKIILAGFTIFLLSVLVMLAFSLMGIMNAYVIIIPVLFINFGIGLIYSLCIAGCLHPYPEHAGSASALFGTIAILGGSISSALMAHVHEVTQTPLVLVFLAQCIVALFIYLVMVRE